MNMNTISKHIAPIIEANQKIGADKYLDAYVERIARKAGEFEAHDQRGSQVDALASLGELLLATHLLAEVYARKTGTDPTLAAESAADKVLKRAAVIESLLAQDVDFNAAVAAAKRRHP